MPPEQANGLLDGIDMGLGFRLHGPYLSLNWALEKCFVAVIDV
jgi:hypothetical protein